MKQKILVLFSDEKNLLKSKEEIENRLFKRVKKGGNIDLIVSSYFIDSIETNSEIFENINGILYTSDIKRKDVEKLTPILKETSNETLMFARVSTNIGNFGLIDFFVKGVTTLTNVEIYPYMIRYSHEEVKSFFV